MKVTDLASLARFILSEECRSIVVLTGAGVSVASGIPDFRSPGGMYDSLQPDLLTAPQHQRQLMEQDPTYVVSWDIFQVNQFPYLEVRRPFILGTQRKKWKATLAHRFFELLETRTAALSSSDNGTTDTTGKSKLTRIYTQNIDGLDYQCHNIPPSKIVSVHGSLSRASCEGCGREVADYDRFCDQVRTHIKDIYHGQQQDDPEAPSESTPVLCEHCGKPLVKPTTVLFGRNLPSEFFDCVQQDLPTCDLLLVAGTSLVVSPANSLVPSVPPSTIRVVVNRDPVGAELGIEYNGGRPPTIDADADADGDADTGRDFFAQGDCDEVFLELIRHLGWIDDLKAAVKGADGGGLLPPRSAELLREKGVL